jgi:isoquinoline 1-oxidoreductase subunit alpha
MVSFTLNNRQVSVDAEPGTPLLWAIRDHVGLTGTKYGCGAGLCGACTIHIDGTAQRSC